MKLFLNIWLLALLLLGCSGSAEQKSEGSLDQAKLKHLKHFNLQWAQHKLWNDGQAEVATYAAERVVYGKVRSFYFTMITVKEDFNREYNVKTDSYNRDDVFPVMKVNQFYSLRTDNYPYHYLTSVFMKREDPVRLHKLTSSSQEWCGNVFKAILQRPDDYIFKYDSYWDGEGRGDKKLPLSCLFEDQLPYTLRSLNFRENLHFAADVCETLQTNRARNPHIYTGSFSVTADTAAQKPAWQVRVRLEKDKYNHYWFAKEHPNELLKLQNWDGRKLQLKELKRYAYWEGD